MDVQELRERFGGLLTAHRKRKRITQEDLADELDMSPDMINRLEGGKSGASFRTIAKLAEALGVDPVAFFSTDLQAGGLRRKKLNQLIVRLARETDDTLDWLAPIIEATLKSRR